MGTVSWKGYWMVWGPRGEGAMGGGRHSVLVEGFFNRPQNFKVLTIARNLSEGKAKLWSAFYQILAILIQDLRQPEI